MLVTKSPFKLIFVLSNYQTCTFLLRIVVLGYFLVFEQLYELGAMWREYLELFGGIQVIIIQYR